MTLNPGTLDDPPPASEPKETMLEMAVMILAHSPTRDLSYATTKAIMEEIEMVLTRFSDVEVVEVQTTHRDPKDGEAASFLGVGND